jgi:hypothetical protein
MTKNGLWHTASKLAGSVALLATIGAATGELQAQDACIALLRTGIYDTHVAQSSAQSQSAFKANFCSWYSSYRQSHSGGSAGLTIPLSDIPIGFNGSMSYGEADAMQQAMCSATASSSSADSSWTQIDRTLNPGGTQAFSACVAALRGGLNIDFRVNDAQTQISVGLAYNPPLGAGPATLNLIKNDGWICTPPDAPQIDLHSIAGKPGQLGNSQVGMVCNRDVKTTPFTVGGQKVVADSAELTLQTTAGLFTTFFRPKLFEDPIADTAKVLASYPKGTILPFAGPSTSIPSGWHVCDGTNGTVNLVDRLPYGASSDGQLGVATEGSATHTHTFSGTTSPPSGVDNPHIVQDGNRALNVKGTDHTHTYGGTTSTSSSLPPVTRVYFIQKIT